MIRVIVQQAVGAIQLFRQQYAHKAMRQCHHRQRQQLLRTVFYRLMQAIRAPDDEGHILSATHPIFHLLRQLFGGEMRAALIQRDAQGILRQRG